MVRVVIDNQIFQCRDYEWETNGIILYDAVYGGSLWRYIEIRSTDPILTFREEIKLEKIIEETPW